MRNIKKVIFYYFYTKLKGWILGIEPKLITPQITVLPLNYIHLSVT